VQAGAESEANERNFGQEPSMPTEGPGYVHQRSSAEEGDNSHGMSENAGDVGSDRRENTDSEREGNGVVVVVVVVSGRERNGSVSF